MVLRLSREGPKARFAACRRVLQPQNEGRRFQWRLRNAVCNQRQPNAPALSAFGDDSRPKRAKGSRHGHGATKFDRAQGGQAAPKTTCCSRSWGICYAMALISQVRHERSVAKVIRSDAASTCQGATDEAIDILCCNGVSEHVQSKA